MLFSLINKEPLTNDYLIQLQNFGFENIEIDVKENLTFIDINDEKYNCFITKLYFNHKLQHCLHIYSSFSKTNVRKNIDIPLSIIETVDMF